MPYLNVKDLVVLENGDILKKNGNVIGNSIDISTWDNLFEQGGMHSLAALQGLYQKIKGKVNLPSLFLAKYGVEYNNKLRLMALLTPTPNSKDFLFEETEKFAESKIYILTPNPFQLSGYESAKAQAPIEARKARIDAEFQTFLIKRMEYETILLQLLKQKMVKAPNLRLEKGKDLHNSKVIVLLDGVDISSIAAQEFVKKAFPEMWEEYDNL